MAKLNRILSGIIGCCLLLTFGVQAQESAPSVEMQIKAATSAAPPNLKEGAAVWGYDENSELITLRKGTNELICIADDPQKPKFHVACYFEELEPFMKRGRELRAEGVSRAEVDSIRQAEIKAGRLPMPQKPMALYNLSGPEDGFDYSTGEVKKATPLYVVYVPYATEASTGISTAPAGEGGPWLMEAGKPWAHVMIPGRPVGTDDQ